jgi:uroporphyrinogen-III decarboxylase
MISHLIVRSLLGYQMISQMKISNIFNQKGGFVFATIHNIQCNTPVENILAMFEALGRNL